MIRWLAFLTLAGLLGAQTPAPRKKIGVALSGGAALGLVHVGVLEWLEQNRIPVDYIAGTSMGGLVGGMWASGMTADEMKELVRTIDWEDALRVNPDFTRLRFRRKEDRREFPNALEFGLKGGFKLPPGLSPGHGVGKVLSRVAGPYGELGSFNELPTPFRCVATDIITGEGVVFDKGLLFDAMRSTMSLPAVFAPWKVDGRTFVDGALVNNVPVDVVKAMGADIIIAVGLYPPLPKKAPDNILGVAGRSISIMISANEKRNLDAADILIMPDLEGLTGTDYAKGKEFIERGQKGTELKSGILRTLAVNGAAYQEYQAARAAKRRRFPDPPQQIEVSGVSISREKRLAAELGDLAGKPLDIARLENDLDDITGFGAVSSADYRALPGNGLGVRVREKTHGPPFLNTAVLIDGTTSEGSRFGVGGRLTYLDFLSPGAEWRTDFNIGGLNSLQTEYYRPLGNSSWFVAPRLFFQNDLVEFFDGNSEIASLRFKQYGTAADVGVAISRRQEFRAGYRYAYEKISQESGPLVLPNFSDHNSAVRLRYAFEGQDSAILPRKGWRGVGEARWNFNAPLADRQFPAFDGTVSYARPLAGPFFLNARFSAGATGRGQFSIPPQTLGGPFRLSALARNQQFGNRYYYLYTGALRNIFPNKTGLLGKVYYNAAWEIGQAWTSGERVNPFNDGVLGVVAETGIGVLFFGGSYGESGERKVFFRLGRYF